MLELHDAASESFVDALCFAPEQGGPGGVIFDELDRGVVGLDLADRVRCDLRVGGLLVCWWGQAGLLVAPR